VVAQVARHAANRDFRAQQALILGDAAQLDDAVTAGRDLLPGHGDGVAGARDLERTLALAGTDEHAFERLAIVAGGLAEPARKSHLYALLGEPNKGRYAEGARGGTGGICKGKRASAHPLFYTGAHLVLPTDDQPTAKCCVRRFSTLRSRFHQIGRHNNYHVRFQRGEHVTAVLSGLHATSSRSSIRLWSDLHAHGAEPIAPIFPGFWPPPGNFLVTPELGRSIYPRLARRARLRHDVAWRVGQQPHRRGRALQLGEQRSALHQYVYRPAGAGACQRPQLAPRDGGQTRRTFEYGAAAAQSRRHKDLVA